MGFDSFKFFKWFLYACLFMFVVVIVSASGFLMQIFRIVLYGVGSVHSILIMIMKLIISNVQNQHDSYIR